MDQTGGVDSRASIVRLARQVLSIAEDQSNRPSDSQEDLLRLIRKLQVAVEGPAHYVMRKRHQVARTPLEFFEIHELVCQRSG